MINRVIAAIGLEVEGPFKDYPPSIRDASSKRIGNFHAEWMPRVENSMNSDRGGWEAVSRVLKNRTHILEYFNEIEPTFMGEQVTGGMGLHVHFSFREPEHYVKCFNKHFAETLTKEFIETFKDKPFVAERLEYESSQGTQFCKLDYSEDYFKVARGGKKNGTTRRDRYYAVNFWGALDDHKTFEFRVPPAGTISDMKEYVEWVINRITEYVLENDDDGKIFHEEKIDLKRKEPIKIIKTRRGKTYV